MDTQWYIGAPNGVVVCVDDTDGLEGSGRLYHAYDEEPVSFDSWGELIVEVDDLCDRLNFPHALERGRVFETDAAGAEGRAICREAAAGRRIRRGDRLVPDKELLRHTGQCATFVVRVQQRRNRTWQGRISWKEEDETLRFFSILELLKMIGAAVHPVSPVRV